LPAIADASEAPSVSRMTKTAAGPLIFPEAVPVTISPRMTLDLTDGEARAGREARMGHSLGRRSLRSKRRALMPIA
jgi:hypothetical protein